MYDPTVGKLGRTTPKALLFVIVTITEESYITKIEYGFDIHDVEIVDTAGQEEFLGFRNSSISRGDGFLGLFAINSVTSWFDLKELRKKILRDSDDEPIPMVIIANKSVSCVLLLIEVCSDV